LPRPARAGLEQNRGFVAISRNRLGRWREAKLDVARGHDVDRDVRAVEQATIVEVADQQLSIRQVEWKVHAEPTPGVGLPA
jgi:hypothetical protein